MHYQIQDFQALTDILGDRRWVIERVRMTQTGVAVEGAFEPPPLARLSAEDQVFVVAFLHSHGSIREMEQAFGVSYPTVKARLNRIAGALPLADVTTGPAGPRPEARSEVLAALERGDITADQAIEKLGAL